MLIFRLLNWIVRRLGVRTFFILLLLLSGLFSAVLALTNIVSGLEGNLLFLAAFMGVALGWGLAAYQPIPGWLAGFVALILGVEFAIIRVSRLTIILTDLLQNLAIWGWQFWQNPLAGWPDASALMLNAVTLNSAVGALFSRLLGWLMLHLQGKPAFDPLAALLIWAITIWLVAGWAGWAIRRWNQPLAALAPLVALLVTVLAYTPRQANYLLPVVGVTLILVGLVGYQAREQRWQASHIDYAPTIETELLFAILPISAALLLVGWVTPSISAQQMTSAARQFFSAPPEQGQPVAGSLGVEPPAGNEPAPLNAYRAPGLPQQHLLGSGPELSEQVALIISASTAPSPARRYYWRSLTYDVYNGWGWNTSETKIIDYNAGDPATASVSDSSTRQLLRQQVQTTGRTGGLLYAAGDIVTTDQNYRLGWRSQNDYFAGLVETTIYQVDSLVPQQITETQLRAAGNDYPDWIRQRYLHLPKTVPERVRSLARDLTATATTPYDQARAIEAYLRRFPYTLNLPKPPVNRDMVDYFLFDLQQGYCDYYATSMVVLARAAGLPARLAVGYASGAYDPQSGKYIVTEADAHSWVEIYFPQYGWIEFEPTAALPVNSRTGQPDLARLADPLSLPDPAAPATNLAIRPEWWSIAIFAGGLLVLGAGGWRLADKWRLRRLGSVALAATLYRRLHRQGHQLAVPEWAGETPYEFAAALAKRIEALATGQRWQAILTPAVHEAQWLANLYVRAAYSSHQPTLADRREAIQIWHRLQRRLWLARFSAWVGRFGNAP